MCGRFSLATSKEKIHEQLPFVETTELLKVSYNIAPTQHAYVVTNDQPERLQYIIWGLVPHWSNDGKNSGRLINARLEGIEAKPSFRVPIRKRRCLVLADSFYEWRKEGRQKIPYRIFLKNGELLLLAGIWDVWYKGDYAVKTFSILTTLPNQEMQTLHDRMPVILTTKEQQERWLTATEVEDVLEIPGVMPDGILEMYRVSEQLNFVQNDSAELHRKVAEPRDLFS